jgi:lactoylglutathione lyase
VYEQGVAARSYARPVSDLPLRPSVARLTHVALPCHDLDVSLAWYQQFTPLRLVRRMSDDAGESAWIGQPDMGDSPFVVVLVCFDRDRANGPLTQLAPFAHLGVELPTRDDVDAVAAAGREAGCLVWEPQQLPAPVGYVCALADPDGNVVEFSFDQGVYAAVRGPWG